MPLPPTPPEPKPLDPPSRALVPPPTPQGILQKKSFFFFLYKTSKIRRKLRNLLRPWGPYHLPPRHRSPWTPPPPSPSLKLPSSPYAPPTLSCNQGPWFTALSTRPAPVGNPPPPHRASFKKHHFFLLFVRVRNVKNTTQVAVPLPPRPEALGPPPSPSLGPRGGPRGHLFSVWKQFPFVKLPSSTPNPLLQPRPLVYRPVHQASSGG